MSASIFLVHWSELHDFLCALTVAVPRFSSGGVAICYISSLFAIIGRMQYNYIN